MSDQRRYRVVSLYLGSDVRYEVQSAWVMVRTVCVCELLDDANTICDALNEQYRQQIANALKETP